MNSETRLVFTDKGARSIKAGFAMIVCSGLIMVAAMVAALFLVPKIWASMPQCSVGPSRPGYIAASAIMKRLAS